MRRWLFETWLLIGLWLNSTRPKCPYCLNPETKTRTCRSGWARRVVMLVWVCSICKTSDWYVAREYTL